MSLVSCWFDWNEPLRKVGLSPFCVAANTDTAGEDGNVQFRWGRLEILLTIFVLVWFKPLIAQHPRAKITGVVPQLQTEVCNCCGTSFTNCGVLLLETNFFFSLHYFSNSRNLSCRTLLQKLLKSQTYFMYFISTTECNLNYDLGSSSLKNSTTEIIERI